MFERFTNQARRTVVLAQEEARALRHDWIGTEHLVLALLRDPSTGAAAALTTAGVTLDSVRREIEELVAPGESEPTGHIPFTPRSKKVLELALREAIKAKHRTIEPEHILLGLIREGEGLAAQVLIKLGADLEDVRRDTLRYLRDPAAGGLPSGPPVMGGWTRGGAAIFDRARALSQGRPMGSQHLLLGLFGEEDSLAMRALTNLGVSREAVEKELAALDAADSVDEPADEAGARRTRLQVAGDVVTLRLHDAELAGRLGASLRQWRRPGEQLELAGTHPEAAEPFAQLWRAVRGTSEALMRRLGDPSVTGPWGGPARGEWKPPGWSTRASVAGYSVMSRPEGPASRLWTNEEVDREEVRRWLADWLAASTFADRPGPHQEVGCSFFTAHVGRQGEVVPDAPDPDAWTVTNFSFGPGPAPSDWPRIPLEEMVAFAITDLRAPESEAQ